MEKHYSELVIDALVTIGWERLGKLSARKHFPNGTTGGALNPNGDRVIHADFSMDSERQRYLSLFYGFIEIKDFSCRNRNPADIAAMVDRYSQTTIL